MDSIKSFEIEVSPVHDLDGVGRSGNQIHDIHVVGFAVGDRDKSGDGTAEVEQGVKLDRRLGFAEVSPREEREAQIDNRGVESVSRLIQLDSEVFPGVKLFRPIDQNLGQVGPDAPVPPFVGFGQGVAADSGVKSGMIQFGAHGAQTGFDVAQALPAGELSESHSQKLIEAGKKMDPVIALILCHTAMKFVLGQEIQELSKNDSTLVHWPLLSAPSGQKNGQMIDEN